MSRVIPFIRGSGGQRVDTARSRFQATTTAELLEIPPPLVHERTLASRRCCGGAPGSTCRQGRACARPAPPVPRWLVVALATVAGAIASAAFLVR
jgi:hypothetical protein